MELTLTIILGIILAALVCEIIDSSLGMLYGTILSPVLIIAGVEPLLVVPSILFSQAMGGFMAAIFHHRLKNVNFTVGSLNPGYIAVKVKNLGFKEAFKKGITKDLKVVFCLLCLGVVMTIFSVLIAISIPKAVLKTYIGFLELAMGVILLLKSNFKFSWRKMIGVGILGAFNKGMSGGGFGPVITSGQIISGQKSKSSIGITTLTETLICLLGFLTYFFTKGISNWNLVLLLTLGALIGAIFGPFFTAKFKSEKKLKSMLGVLVLFLGIIILLKTWIF